MFYLNIENVFFEDLSANKLNKIIKKVKCGLYDKKQKILILSNEEKIYLYSFEYEIELSMYKLYEIDNVNNDEYIITDMILIKNNDNNEEKYYFFVCNNIGNIILYNWSYYI